MKIQKNILCTLPILVHAALCLILGYAYYGKILLLSFPSTMFFVGCIIWVICLLLKSRLVPWFVTLSYLLGYILGALFCTKGTDPGGGATLNDWIIWIGTYVSGIAVGIAIEIAKWVIRFVRCHKSKKGTLY